MSIAATVGRHVRVFGIQLKNNYVREAVYRSNFLTSIVTDLVWIAVEFTLFKVIYANVETLGGWNEPQTYFFLGIFFSSDAIFTTLFQRNFWNFSDLVQQGELDILLTKPVHPLFLALTRYISLTNVFNFALGIAITLRFAEPAGFAGGWHWLLVPFWLAVGAAAALLICFAFAVWVFWTDRSWAMLRLYYQCFQMANKPDTFFPRGLRYLILTALPFALIGSVPARALLEGLRPWEYAAVAGSLLGFFLLNRTLWRAGLKRYQSASS